MNVESKVLINLESVCAIIWSRGKGGRNGEALCLSNLSTVQPLDPRLVTQKFENWLLGALGGLAGSTVVSNLLLNHTNTQAVFPVFYLIDSEAVEI